MKTRILVVEDHENLRSSIRSFLENDGYDVEVAENLAIARKAIEGAGIHGPQLVLLDWMLPDGQGIDLLKELRSNGKRMPVIFLTAKADVLDKVLGLELGANDYMTKPFESRELTARIRARLREVSSQISSEDSEPTLIRVGPLTIDRRKHRVLFAAKEIELVKKEFDLLALFAESPERVFSRDEILNRVWGYDVYPTTRTVDTHVMLLRQKIDERLIETVRAVGYRLKEL